MLFSIQYFFRRLFIYIRAIIHIREVVDVLEASGYIMEKHWDNKVYNRERLLNNKVLLKIGAWRIK